MAFFKFRKDGDEHTNPPPAPESVEAMRKRAKHRLIGAAVLVLVGVVGFPMLFDNQPRPIPVDFTTSRLSRWALAHGSRGIQKPGLTPNGTHFGGVSSDSPGFSLVFRF